MSTESSPTPSKTDFFFEVLAGESVEVQCTKCSVFEWVVALDEPLDSVFLANYHCDECDTPA